jgi:hypothetical protein
MSHSLVRKWKWILIPLATVPAIRIYYIQEMIAALIIFSLLFLAISMVVFFLFLLDRVSEQIIIWTEVGISRLEHRLVEAANIVIARPVWVRVAPHRFRKEQLKERN